LGVAILEIAILGALQALTLVILVIGIRKIMQTLDLLFQALDNKINTTLEEIITQFGENIASNIEPINPFQQIIANYVSNMIENPGPIQVKEIVEEN
tara:strand:- start:161 stop:451 length:291 start_codon:yes stop_codon:yes gene_type:complete